VGRWEGDLWAGKVKGTAGIFIDERADERQAEALPLIFGGQAGGFPAQVAALFTEGRQVRGVERARIAFEIAPDRATLGSGDRQEGQGLGKSVDGTDKPAGKVSAAHERARLRDRTRPAASDLGQVDDLLR
jgi:hypothetical protein